MPLDRERKDNFREDLEAEARKQDLERKCRLERKQANQRKRNELLTELGVLEILEFLREEVLDESSPIREIFTRKGYVNIRRPYIRTPEEPLGSNGSMELQVICDNKYKSIRPNAINSNLCRGVVSVSVIDPYSKLIEITVVNGKRNKVVCETQNDLLNEIKILLNDS